MSVTKFNPAETGRALFNSGFGCAEAILIVAAEYKNIKSNKPEDVRDVLNSKVNEFIREFKERYNSTGCTDLTSCNLSTDEGLKKFNELNKHKGCADIVATATSILIPLMD